jgi:hypothetical protein
MAVLIDRPPQIMPFALDGEKDLIKMPFVTGLRTPRTLRMVTGMPSSAAMRRMRFFIVVALVPSGSRRQVAAGVSRAQRCPCTLAAKRSSVILLWNAAADSRPERCCRRSKRRFSPAR